MQTTYQRLEALTRKWWFYLAFLALFLLPAYSAEPLDPRRTPDLIVAVLSHPLIESVPTILPIFKLLPAVMVLSLAIWGDRVTRLFDVYAGFIILATALFQNTAITQEFGFAVVAGNVIVYSLVAALWFWEAIVKANILTFPRQSLWRYWVVPLAFLAFWFPVDPQSLGPDFSPAQLLTNGAGLALCMMLPVFLAILALNFPTVNLPVLRASSFAGLVTAGLNFLQWFLFTSYHWVGILHVPLLTISLYGLILSRKRQAAAPSDDNSVRA
jgi:hypothetical protein